MAACAEYEERLDLHAAGALEDEETVRVVHHLETCAGCRAAFAASVEVLSLAALPPPTAAEQATLEQLPRRALPRWRRDERHRGLRRRTLGSVVAAAAVVALMLLVPGMPWRSKPVVPPDVPAAPVAGTEVDAETMAAIEAWAGLEPLEEDWDDEDMDFNEGEPL